MEDLIGQTLGQYQIEKKIGEGGMGVIYKAYQPNLNRYVAIKVLRPAYASKKPASIKRFKREAQAIAKLNHPNILPVYDCGVEGDYNYIVMRYVEEGQTLSDLMHQSPLTHEQAIYLISQIAKALTFAHQRGVIHRDVKPDNILIDNDQILLTDFGIAKIIKESEALTEAGGFVGTLAYMSPEQGRGKK